MHKQSAVWLRHAFKKALTMETTEMPNSDYFEIKMTLHGDRPDNVYLSFSKDGETVAMAPITNADLKRLKSDFAFVKKMKAGSAQSIHEQRR